jgi:hypothetical protein
VFFGKNKNLKNRKYEKDFFKHNSEENKGGGRGGVNYVGNEMPNY